MNPPADNKCSLKLKVPHGTVGDEERRKKKKEKRIFLFSTLGDEERRKKKEEKRIFLFSTLFDSSLFILHSSFFILVIVLWLRNRSSRIC
jgi:hypothetical protein